MKDIAKTIRSVARSVAGRVPPAREVLLERDRLRREVARLRGAVGDPADAPQFVPPGHFYSALPSLAQVARRADRIFGPPPRTLPGIDLREQAQLELVRSWQSFYDEQPFPRTRTGARRYWFENGAYSYSDALFLYFVLRHVRPKRVLEIGSGHSSCVTLDTNELFFDGAVACTFVEPYPDLLRSLLKEGDADRITILASDVQVVDRSVFEELEAGDVLFIDSTHVSKVGSDVNYLLLDVLPRIAPGVYVHFHDVFYPFEYPRRWIEEGRAWSEAYLLRAFLAFNGAFEIVVFNTFLEHFHREFFARQLPLCLENPGGSLWLRRVA